MAKKGIAYQSPVKHQQIPADIRPLGGAGRAIAEAIYRNHAKMKREVERASGGKKTI